MRGKIQVSIGHSSWLYPRVHGTNILAHNHEGGEGASRCSATILGLIYGPRGHGGSKHTLKNKNKNKNTNYLTPEFCVTMG